MRAHCRQITFPLAMIGVVGSDLALSAIGRRIRSHSVLNGRAALVISLLLVRAWRARRAREQSRL